MCLLHTSPSEKCLFQWPVFNWAVFVVAAVKLQQFLAHFTDPAQGVILAARSGSWKNSGADARMAVPAVASSSVPPVPQSSHPPNGLTTPPQPAEGGLQGRYMFGRAQGASGGVSSDSYHLFAVYWVYWPYIYWAQVLI